MVNAPAVSVIIPLYNAEKYIGECLESILAQTFPNFEVIVVDDCSSDGSVKVVESYLEKFDGRLNLTSMNKNSGRPSLPRNKGLLLSRGEYIFFMDNDDLITPTAFEELYTLAKDYEADVVYCEHYYEADINGSNIKLTDSQKKIFVDKPTFETHSLPDRIDKIIEYRFVVMPWTKLIKRKLLIENKIIFPDIIRDDTIWNWCLVLHSEKFLRVPNAVYIWRNVENSITRVEKTPAQKVTFWLNSVVFGVKTLHEALSRIKFLQENPKLHFALLRNFIKIAFDQTREASFQMEPFVFYETVYKEFSKHLGEYGVLVPLLCSFINEQQITIKKRNQIIAKWESRSK